MDLLLLLLLFLFLDIIIYFAVIDVCSSWISIIIPAYLSCDYLYLLLLSYCLCSRRTGCLTTILVYLIIFSLFFLLTRLFLVDIFHQIILLRIFKFWRNFLGLKSLTFRRNICYLLLINDCTILFTRYDLTKVVVFNTIFTEHSQIKTTWFVMRIRQTMRIHIACPL